LREEEISLKKQFEKDFESPEPLPPVKIENLEKISKMCEISINSMAKKDKIIQQITKNSVFYQEQYF